MLARSPNSETMVGKDCSGVIDGEVISVLLALDGDQTRSSTTATRDLNLDELYRLSSMSVSNDASSPSVSKIVGVMSTSEA